MKKIKLLAETENRPLSPVNTAVIAEYNPFHNGHLFHLKKTREITGCENIIVVMSGNFVQRGEPAVFEKHIRARHALMNGADMVIELPVEYASGAADVFSGAAVEILDKSGIVDALCFGSEEGCTEVFKAIANAAADENDVFKTVLREHVSEGTSYPTARAMAVSEVLKHNFDPQKVRDIMNRPNNILAIEYMTALKRLNSRIGVYTVKREANDYNDTVLGGALSSAAAIRQAFANGENIFGAVPENTHSDYKNAVFPDLDRYSTIFSYILRTMPADLIAETADVTDGLENRFLRFADIADISGIISAVKSKNYTHAKLRRAALHIILGITKQMQRERPKYIRVLGVRREKKHLINELAQKSSLPVITRVKENEILLQREILTTDIYHIITDNKTGEEYKNGVLTV